MNGTIEKRLSELESDMIEMKKVARLFYRIQERELIELKDKLAESMSESGMISENYIQKNIYGNEYER